MATEFDHSFTYFSRLGECGADAREVPWCRAGAEAARTVLALDQELSADAVGRLQQAIDRMDRFLQREESRRKGDADPTRVLGYILADEGRRLLRGALRSHRVDSGPAHAGIGPAHAGIEESTLRSAYRLIGTLSNLAAWSAPASQESHALNSFPLAAARDVVAYARYGCAETTRQEVAYAALLGFDPADARLLLTSSGMAAYALIENFLLRDVCRPGERVVIHPGVYFETQEQLRSLPFLETHVAAGPSRHAILEAVAAHQPKIVFVDPLTNTADLRLLDLPRLLRELSGRCAAETWVVIDGTLLSGGFNPFALPRPGNIRVLYYESGCKYLQFGMDLGPAGIVVTEPGLAERFERLRRGLGAIASEPIILPRVSRSAYLAYLRAQTACAQAVARAVEEHARAADEVALLPVFPGRPDHPDHDESLAYPHLGGVLAFRFLDARLNQREFLEDFIDMLMMRARAARLALTAGVSFGYRVPRIGAAWSSYDSTGAFLRLSAGVDAEAAATLGTLIARCAAEAAAPDQYCI
jgi:cystathionine gamma-synthase